MAPRQEREPGEARRLRGGARYRAGEMRERRRGGRRAPSRLISHVGVAYVNPTTRELGACEFVDDEQFCALEAVICQLGAKECVVPAEASRSRPRAAASATWSLGAAPWPPSASPRTSTRATWRTTSRACSRSTTRAPTRAARLRGGGGGRGGRRAAQGAPREGRPPRHLAAVASRAPGRPGEPRAVPSEHARHRAVRAPGLERAQRAATSCRSARRRPRRRRPRRPRRRVLAVRPAEQVPLAHGSSTLHAWLKQPLVDAEASRGVTTRWRRS